MQELAYKKKNKCTNVREKKNSRWHATWGCRFTTQEPDAEHATPGANKKVTQQDIRSLVLSECQYQFTLGRSAKNGTTDADQVGDESGAFGSLISILTPSLSLSLQHILGQQYWAS